MTWNPIATAPTDGEQIEVAQFDPRDGVEANPRYVVAVAWGTAFPSTIQCAAYSGWFVCQVPVMDPATSKTRVNMATGVLPTHKDFAPTHWRTIASAIL
jgi:hypothetical protein